MKKRCCNYNVCLHSSGFKAEKPEFFSLLYIFFLNYQKRMENVKKLRHKNQEKKNETKDHIKEFVERLITLFLCVSLAIALAARSLL